MNPSNSNITCLVILFRLNAPPPGSPLPSHQRKYLLTFKGSRYSNFGLVRNRIRPLNNDRDVIMRLKCFLDVEFDPECKTDRQIYDE